MQKLNIICNESIFNNGDSFFCDNIDIKSTPEGLNKSFEINLIGRSSKIIRNHLINLSNVKNCNNVFTYLYEIFKTFKNDDSKYLIISISPFTFLACILIKLFRRKPIVYLRSDGYAEYRSILGFIGPSIYHLMFSIISKISNFISVRKYILRDENGEIVAPSQLNFNWFKDAKKVNSNEIKLLYVGRIRKEKGIFSLIKILKESKKKISLSIVGAENNFDKFNFPENIKIFEIENNETNLIKYYDDHNIFILPSFTEGHPMVLLEALARLRPVIVFKDIDHVIEDKKGIFVAERNIESLVEKIEFIKKNYESIQDEMKKNKLPTKQEFLESLIDIIVKIN